MDTEPIAIVGLGAVFPGAGSAAELWRNVRAGVDSITDVPPGRWDPALYYDPAAYGRAPESDRFYCRRGGFVDDLATFDPERFGIMPAAVPGMEPDQLLALRTAAEAIADAGGEDRLPDRARIGVVLGRGGYITPGVARFDQRVRTSHQVAGVLAELLPDLGADRLAEIRRAFCDRLGPDGPDASVGLVPSFAASRVANRFDLRGPAYTLDAACASSLLAVEHAVRALRGGQCDAMLAGAVHHSHHATLWSVFSQLRALSPSQRIRPFDRAADGTLLAEGTGMVLLKRLSDAERAGDRVHAVIRGTGTSSDGRAASIMSPLVDGQVLAVERAWRDAGLDPAEPHAVGLVEAHGTATPAGDAAELATLRRVFGTGGPPVGLGTVKSMIGHAMPAAGIAGLIKAVCALREGVLPPTLHVEEPHPALAGTRLRPVRDLAEWERPPGAPRRAVVNAFGFGGANAHVILEEPPSASARSRRARPADLLGAAAGDGGGEGVLRLTAASAEEMAELLAVPDERLLARAAAPQREPADLPCRLALVGPTPRRLDLARAVAQRGTPWRGRSDLWFTTRPLLAPGAGRLAFLFPGFEPAFSPRVDGVAAHFGMDDPRLTGRTDLLGHAADVGAVGRLLAGALAALGVEPDVAAGHSLGEWTAMVAMGLFPADAVDAFMAALDPDALHVPDVVYAALGCGVDRAQEAIGARPGTVVSHDNCPHQSVICGPPGDVRAILGRLASEGVLGQELPFRSGFHTPAAEAYLDAMRRSFETVPVHEPRVPLWSATTVAPFPRTAEGVRELVALHLLEPVRFSELTEALHGAGVRVFVQVGPGSLPAFVGDRLGDRDHMAMAANVPERDGMAQLRRVVAALWAEGYGSSFRDGAAPAGPGAGLRLDLGTPLVRLDGAVPPLSQAPRPPAADPVMAELDALLRDAVDSAHSVMEASRPGDAAPRPEDPRGERPGDRPGNGLGSGPGGSPAGATELTTSRIFSLDAMPYLADHCLFPQPAGWPDMSDRFPVVPLTTLLEVMAETARELFPDLVAVGFENVRAKRWVVADPATTAAIHASPAEPGAGDGPGLRRVDVVVEGHTEGTVLLAGRHPAPPAPDGTPLEGEGPPPVTAGQLYAERWMFHGPRFRTVTEIRALAEGGLRAALTSLPTPGALLDGAGQLCGHWLQVYGDKDQNMLPIGIERVSWYGSAPLAGERLETTVRIRAVARTAVRCDVELVRADGAVWARIDGWTTRRFYTDEAVWRMRFTPEVSGTGEPQPGGWCLARRRWDGASSRDLLMRQYLCAAERGDYQALAPRDQDAWLLGRIAAKDAVREWLWNEGHGPLFPAELTVRDGATPRRPSVTGPFERPLTVAIDADARLGAALVRPEGDVAGIALQPVPEGEGPGHEGGWDGGHGSEGDGDRGGGVERARLRTAERAVAMATGIDTDHLAVTVADTDRLLVAAGGTVTAVQSTLVDGHVVTWTVAAHNAGNDNAGESWT